MTFPALHVRPSPLLENLLLFARVLRRLGFGVTPDRFALWLSALERVSLAKKSEVRSASRAVWASRHEEVALFDRVFDLFFRGNRPVDPLELGRLITRRQRVSQRLLGLLPGDPDAVDTAEEGETVVETLRAPSGAEVLRLKDFAALTDAERATVLAWLRQQPLPPLLRRSRRFRPGRGGDVLDLKRTLRKSLARGGELVELARRRRRQKPRPLVVLCDLSGSMEPYARVLLELLYVLSRGSGRRELFAFGTRLTRLTRALSDSDPDRALAEASRAVVDFGGGTRIGEALRRFNVDWGRRVLGQGAVVLLVSDGLDRGEPELVARELGHLARSCRRLIWANPLLGLTGYQPLARSMAAALPLVDDFVPIHNLRSLEDLARSLERLDRR